MDAPYTPVSCASPYESQHRPIAACVWCRATPPLASFSGEFDFVDRFAGALEEYRLHGRVVNFAAVSLVALLTAEILRIPSPISVDGGAIRVAIAKLLATKFAVDDW